MGVAIKRVAPLLPMLRIAPAGFVRSDVSLGTLLEGDSPRLFDQLGGALRATVLEWIYFFCSQAPRIGR